MCIHVCWSLCVLHSYSRARANTGVNEQVYELASHPHHTSHTQYPLKHWKRRPELGGVSVGRVGGFYIHTGRSDLLVSMSSVEKCSRMCKERVPKARWMPLHSTCTQVAAATTTHPQPPSGKWSARSGRPVAAAMAATLASCAPMPLVSLHALGFPLVLVLLLLLLLTSLSTRGCGAPYEAWLLEVVTSALRVLSLLLSLYSGCFSWALLPTATPGSGPGPDDEGMPDTHTRYLSLSVGTGRGLVWDLQLRQQEVLASRDAGSERSAPRFVLRHEQNDSIYCREWWFSPCPVPNTFCVDGQTLRVPV